MNVDAIVTEAFTDNCFDVASRIVGVVVQKWVPHFAESMKDKADHYVRGCVGMAMLTVAVSQLRLVGMKKEEVAEILSEEWDGWKDDASPSSSDPKGEP
jgi:hypothetical protein